jgi:hypothetical protein
VLLSPRVGLTNAPKGFHVRIKQARREHHSHVAQHSIEENAIVAEDRERFGRLQLRGECSVHLPICRPDTRLRTLNHEVRIATPAVSFA